MRIERAERRLSAIFACDVAGFTRLMSADEEGTLKTLHAHRRECLEPKFAEHRGRVVKWTGDGSLVEFGSAVDAARCAIDIQGLMAERNADVVAELRIEFRIAIHVGDIIIEPDGDIFGDGVNLAARLEGIAAVGGICMSDDAYRQVRGKVDATIEDGGELRLKNFTGTVRVFLVRPSAKPANAMTPLRPGKPSIAVLAFQNMSGDPEQEFFADGIAEDIIATLSKSRWLFVIARNSTFTYKGKATDLRQVGRDLGVRYVLQGSVRKAGNRVRVTALLIDADTGHHVWAERYDRALEDIFAIQDEITRNIVGAIAPGIVSAEVQRSLGKQAGELGQWERLMRAHWHVRRFTPADCNEAIRLLEELVRHEPDNALALSDLSYAWFFAGIFGWTKEPASVAMGLARQFGRRAIAADDQDAAVYAVLGVFDMFVEGRHEEGRRRLRRALEIDPNSSFARVMLGTIDAFVGDAESAIGLCTEAMHLSPRDFLMVLCHLGIGWAHLNEGNFEQAAEHAARAIESNPAFPDTHSVFAVATAHLGRMAEARAALAEFLVLLPGLTLSDDRLKRPFVRPADRARFLEGLRLAGLPE
ncbi:MAG: adenylate/guanylate cyclase domain-containing protein [Paracraurococcus sp.]